MKRPAILVIASPELLGAICDGLADRGTYEIVIPDLDRADLLAETQIDGIISSFEIGRDLGAVMIELPRFAGLPIKVTVRGITVGMKVTQDPLVEALDVLDQMLLGTADLESVTPLAG